MNCELQINLTEGNGLTQIKYLLSLHSMEHMGAARLKALLAYFAGDAAAAWEHFGEWVNVPELSKKIAAQLITSRQEADADVVYERFLASGAGIVSIYDSKYPAALRYIHMPPLLLFYRGNLPAEDDIVLALIGSRQATAYGRQVAEILSRDLAMQGIYIVSGGARGIDSYCHQAAIDAGGKTIAVIGSGIDIVYPRENKNLYQAISENGAVISEFPLGTGPVAGNFPQRNRIISGIARGVIVIEAGDKSGTLLTVDHGLEQGKDIFAVPGPITSAASKGTNELIRQGAKMVTTAKDVWGEYFAEPRVLAKKDTGDAQKAELSRQEAELLKLMVMPAHFDALATESGMPAQKLGALLTIWEIRGLVRQFPGKMYQAQIKKI
jgi:DNA processing protein